MFDSVLKALLSPRPLALVGMASDNGVADIERKVLRLIPLPFVSSPTALV